MNKVLTLLGFASKAGKLCFGMDMSKAAIKAKKSLLIITACDVSEKSKKEIGFFTANSNIPLISLNDIDIDTVSKAVGRKCGIISVNDKSFADAISEAITCLLN